ncbi:MAG: ferrous iron transport protein B [Oscillospiraceae bacterium]|nr:ferrous iron transport protein B [Oscillospiraceae bacterium]
MGLTASNTGKCCGDIEHITDTDSIVLALAGNPNVGKSTVFNFLTGLHQHTGNWTGKTVQNACGSFSCGENSYTLVDIPGTYSILAHSAEEEAARDFICFGGAQGVAVVCDASCLERNLNLVLQILEITPHVVVCVNLIDEARKKQISVDCEKLSALLGVPVYPAAARSGEGMEAFANGLSAIKDITGEQAFRCTYDEETERSAAVIAEKLGEKNGGRFAALRILEGDEKLSQRFLENADEETLSAVSAEKERLASVGYDEQKIRDTIVTTLVRKGEDIAAECVHFGDENCLKRDRKIDRVLTHKVWGVPIMAAMLAVIFWITIYGANYPSALLSSAFGALGEKLRALMEMTAAPQWLKGVLLDGIYRILTWVISVMLPPMAIFFPLFTLLEDLGYLPRAAFNLDRYFKRAGACGKQSLTMAMGFGCNAVGITGCRIIDSPRERLIAILTNNFVPCNGRFPALIAIITIFFAAGTGGFGGSLISVGILILFILFGVMLTLLISKLLSKTLLKGEPSSFTLELPPYRRPQIGKILIRSLLDRTVFVLGRAVTAAAPAGLIIWLAANVQVGGESILSICSGALDPFARLFGMDGVILFAFILGFPANEIVIPIMLMGYLSSGVMTDYENLDSLKNILLANGWTPVTAVCTLIFMLCHFPCSTSLMTMKKETGSLKWTLLGAALPTAVGLILCAAVSGISNLII